MNELLFLGLIVILLWGIWGFAAKVAISDIGLQAIFWISVISDILIVVYLLISNQFFPLRLEERGIMYSIISGITGGIAIILFYILLKKYQASIVLPLTSLYPVVVVILGILILKEKITYLNGIGVVLALISIYLLSK